MTEHTPSELLARVESYLNCGKLPFEYPGEILRDCLPLIRSQAAAAGREAREPAAIDLTNHHNALKCPYCNPKGLTLAAPPAASVTREVIEKAICCPDGCVRDVDCWAKHQTGHTRQVIKAILAAVSSPSTEGG